MAAITVRYDVIVDFEAIVVGVWEGRSTIIPFEGAASVVDRKEGTLSLLWCPTFKYDLRAIAGTNAGIAEKIGKTYAFTRPIHGLHWRGTGGDILSELNVLEERLNDLEEKGGYRLWAKGCGMENWLLDRRGIFPGTARLRGAPRWRVGELEHLGCKKMEAQMDGYKDALYAAFDTDDHWAHFYSHSYGRKGFVFGVTHCARIETMAYGMWMLDHPYATM